MRRFAMLAAIPVAALLVTGTVVAQEEEDEAPAPRVIPAEECQVEPRPADELFVTLGLEETPATPAERGPALAVPLGQPANFETRDAIADTVRLVLACFNAGDIPRAAALMTDAGAQRFFGTGPREEAAAEALRARIGETPTPRDERASTRLLAITDVSVLEDGRVAAFVIINEPFLPPQGPETLLFVFVQEGDTWLVDDYVDFTVIPLTLEEILGTPTGEATPVAEEDE